MIFVTTTVTKDDELDQAAGALPFLHRTEENKAPNAIHTSSGDNIHPKKGMENISLNRMKKPKAIHTYSQNLPVLPMTWPNQ